MMRFILPIALALVFAAPALAQDKAPPKPPVQTPKTEEQKTETPKTEAQNTEAPKTDAQATGAQGTGAQKPAETQPAASKPEVTKNGDWFVGCQSIEVDGSSVKACEMQQILEETKSGQAFIRISVIYPRDSKKPVLRIMTPLGVLLQKGMSMQIDDGKEIVLPFAICVGKPASCIVDGVMEDSIVDAMKRGNAGTLTISFGNNQIVKAPFSLNGFTKSITSIAPK